MKMIDYPDLMIEWDYEKNKELDPAKISGKSNRKVYWKCKKGHSFLTAIYDRTRTDRKALGCPYCANKRVLAGFNDLATVRSDLLKEWDYSKNKNSPSEYVAHTDKKVFWICVKGHSYEMRICEKTKENPYGCPVCSNKKLLVGFNDLKALFPEVAEEWDYEKNDTKPEEHIAGTHKKAYWKCKQCGHEWKAQIKERTYGGTSCPNCSFYYKTSLPEQTIYYYVKRYFPEAVNSYKPEYLNCMEIDIFIPTLNVGIEYDGSSWHFNNERDYKKSELLKENQIKLIRIKESNATNDYDDYYVIKSQYKDNIEQLSPVIKELFGVLNKLSNGLILADIDIMRDSSEIYGLVADTKKRRSLLADNPDILKEWSYELNNPLTPDKVTPKSNKIVWWRCSKCNKTWQQRIKTKKTLMCPSCSYSFEANRRVEQKIKEGEVKSVADYPLLLKEWNDERDPHMISYGSEYKAKWKCSVCGKEFKQIVKNRTLQKQGCPKCKGIIKKITIL